MTFAPIVGDCPVCHRGEDTFSIRPDVTEVDIELFKYIPHIKRYETGFNRDLNCVTHKHLFIRIYLDFKIDQKTFKARRTKGLSVAERTVSIYHFDIEDDDQQVLLRKALVKLLDLIYLHKPESLETDMNVDLPKHLGIENLKRLYELFKPIYPSGVL